MDALRGPHGWWSLIKHMADRHDRDLRLAARAAASISSAMDPLMRALRQQSRRFDRFHDRSRIEVRSQRLGSQQSVLVKARA
jgi:hypothetical protein